MRSPCGAPAVRGGGVRDVPGVAVARVVTSAAGRDAGADGCRTGAGEHTDATLRALGMTDGLAAALRRGGVIVDTALSGGRTGPDSRRSAAAAEERTPQSPQRGEERDTRAPAPAGVRGVARREFEHQQRRFRRLALRDGGTAQHCEMTVEARTGRTAPTCDRRHTRPAAHRYLFHVTPHPYEGTRPGQVNPIVPRRHTCIPAAGLHTRTRVLTSRYRILSVPGRVELAWRGFVRTAPRC